MPRTLLSGIAIAAGTGLAVGFGFAFGSRRSRSRGHRPVNIEPLIERLDRIEARVNEAEWRMAPAGAGELSAAVRTSLTRMDERLIAQSREIELLRIRAAEDEALAAAEIRLTERRFKEAAAAIPAEIEAIVAPRAEHLREHLRREMKESIGKALGTFEVTLDERISSRINSLENRLLEHSTSLADLTHRASQSNANLEKLVSAVERLCDRRAPQPAPAAAPVAEPTLLELKSPEQAAETLRWSVPREDEPLRSPRVTLAHVMIAAAAAFIGTRFLR
jgi:hypothetical protein